MKYYVLKATQACPENLKNIIQCDGDGKYVPPHMMIGKYMPPTLRTRKEAFTSLARMLIANCELFWNVADFELIHDQLDHKWEDFDRYKTLRTLNLIGSEVSEVMKIQVKRLLMDLKETDKVLLLWEFKPEFRTWFDLHEIEVTPTGIIHKINDKQAKMRMDIPLELTINMKDKISSDVESVEIDFKDQNKSDPPLIEIINDKVDEPSDIVVTEDGAISGTLKVEYHDMIQDSEKPSFSELLEKELGSFHYRASHGIPSKKDLLKITGKTNEPKIAYTFM